MKIEIPTELKPGDMVDWWFSGRYGSGCFVPATVVHVERTRVTIDVFLGNGIVRRKVAPWSLRARPSDGGRT